MLNSGKQVAIVLFQQLNALTGGGNTGARMKIINRDNISEHEQVVFCQDRETGLEAIIAIHNTSRGVALGGCRMWPYASEEEALTDVLRLSKGMTYKSAMAGLKLGGGKSVIIGDPHKDKSIPLLHAMGRFLNELHGEYIAAEDSGTCVADLKVIGEETPYITGIHEKRTLDGKLRSGDPSPSTALGTFNGLRAAVKYQLDLDELTGLRVAIQGLGNVGFRLAELLHRDGAKLLVCDTDAARVEAAVHQLDATAVNPEEIFSQEVDVFAPCALGAILNDSTIPQLKTSIIAGAANNQLAERRHGMELKERGILYTPDYVINAGGIIDVYFEQIGFDERKLNQHICTIYNSLQEIFIRAERQNLPTNVIADMMAEERFTVPHAGNCSNCNCDQRLLQ